MVSANWRGCEGKAGVILVGMPSRICSQLGDVRCAFSFSQTLGRDWTRYGFDARAITPSGTQGVLNDAVSIYSADAMLASAFIARWCVGAKVETAGGVFQVHKDQPEPRVGAGLHRTARSPYSTRLKRYALSGELTCVCF